MSTKTAVLLAVLVVTATASAVVVGAAASGSTDSEAQADSDAYAGTHVAFESTNDAVTNYSVDGDVVIQRLAVEARSDHRAEADASAGVLLSSATDLSGSELTGEVRTETRAELAAESSASIRAHDSERGILTVSADDEAQYVEATLPDESNATVEGDDRVVVEGEDRTGAFVVVGDGDVTVTEEGDVAAALERDSTLVFRSYEDGERDEHAESQEELIADGTATAEVYVDERDGQRVVDVATYGADLAVNVSGESEQRVEMTLERAESEGTVVIATVSEAVVETAGSVEDVGVTVDGEAAAEASSYGELEGGDEPRYVVTGSSEASASADVLVAVDHASAHEVVIHGSEDDGAESGGEKDANDETGDDGDERTDGEDGAADDGDGGTDESEGVNGIVGGETGVGVAGTLVATIGAAIVGLRP